MLMECVSEITSSKSWQSVKVFTKHFNHCSAVFIQPVLLACPYLATCRGLYEVHMYYHSHICTSCVLSSPSLVCCQNTGCDVWSPTVYWYVVCVHQ